MDIALYLMAVVFGIGTIADSKTAYAMCFCICVICATILTILK